MTSQQDSAFEQLRFSQIPDRIFDYWLFHLTGAEFKVLCYIARRTYGFKREADSISLSQICEGITRRDGVRQDFGTGLSREGASKALSRLSQLGLVIPLKSYDEESKRHFPTEYRLNVLVHSGPETQDPAVKKTPGVVSSVDYPEDGGVVSSVDQGSQLSGGGVVSSVGIQDTVLQHTGNNTQFSPIVPSEPTEENSSEPTGNPQISVDNVCGMLHTSWHTVFGHQGKIRDTESVEALTGEWNTPDDVTEDVTTYHAKRGKDDVAAFVYWKQTGDLRSAPKKFSTKSAKHTGLGWHGDRREDVRYTPKASRQPAPSKREISRQAHEWNEAIPERAWVTWDAKLSSAMQARLSEEGFAEHWDAVLAKCKEIVAKGHPKNGYVTFPWVLKEGNWSALLNRGHDFLLSSEAATSQKPVRAGYEQRNLDLLQRAKNFKGGKTE